MVSVAVVLLQCYCIISCMLCICSEEVSLNQSSPLQVPRTQCLNYFNGDCRLNGSTYDRRPLVLEVPVSSYTNNLDEHFLRKGKGWGTRENPVEVDDYIPGETEFSLEETKLSLSIGGGSSQRMRGWRTQDENAHSIVPHDIIDLEESIRTVSDRDVELKSSLCCAACSANSGERNGFHSSCSCTNSTNKYWSNTAKKSQSLRDESISILEQNSLSQGKIFTYPFMVITYQTGHIFSTLSHNSILRPILRRTIC